MVELIETDWKQYVVLLIGGSEVGNAMVEGFRNKGAEVEVVKDTADMTDLAAITVKVETIITQYAKSTYWSMLGSSLLMLTAIDMPPEQWMDVVQSNIKSKFLYANEVGKHMLQREHGNIIMISSIAGIVASPGANAFAASQGAVHQITRTFGSRVGEARY